MASRCQRSILSCSRCRKRKTKVLAPHSHPLFVWHDLYANSSQCDRQLPACSQCVAAKATCTGISAGDKSTDVPRSIVQHLELEIARLETELSQKHGQQGGMDMDMVHASDILLRMPETSHVHVSDVLLNVPETPSLSLEQQQQQEQTSQAQTFQADGVSQAPGIVTDRPNSHPSRSYHARAQANGQTLRTSILSSKPLQAIVSATLPNDSSATDLLSRVRMGMTPSAAQLSDSTRLATSTTATSSAARANKGSSSSTLLCANNLRSIPIDIIQRLLKKYTSTIQRDSPFLVAATLTQQFQRVIDVLEWQNQHSQSQEAQADGFDTTSVMASHDFLIVYLVLAISVTLGSANNGHEERYMALSTALFQEGIQHFYSLKSFPSEIVWLQTVLLILLYATVFPRSANVWVLSGTAMRACLELGLHREPPDESLDGMDSETLDLRRRVFWSAYCMDRSICSALQRPLSTPDTAINTKFPVLLGDDDTFLGSIAYHKLLSEMLHVHFQREPLPDDLSWDDWVTGMEDRLRTWHGLYGGNYDSTASYRAPLSHHHEMIEFNMARGLMILHRPSPRAPSPSARSLLIAFESASAAARMHSEHIRAGFFRRPWLSAHHTLEAATVVLFCLRHGSAAIAESFTAAQVFEMTKLFTSNLLSIAAQGWPEVSVYASVYERLLAPLLERVFLRRTDLSDSFGSAQDAELVRLLYPGPAHIDKLRFGWQQQQEELSPFDFNLFMIDDYEQWGDAGGGGDFDMENIRTHNDVEVRPWDVLGLNGVHGATFPIELS